MYIRVLILKTEIWGDSLFYVPATIKSDLKLKNQKKKY